MVDLSTDTDILVYDNMYCRYEWISMLSFWNLLEAAHAKHSNKKNDIWKSYINVHIVIVNPILKPVQLSKFVCAQIYKSTIAQDCSFITGDHNIILLCKSYCLECGACHVSWNRPVRLMDTIKRYSNSFYWIVHSFNYPHISNKNYHNYD